MPYTANKDYRTSKGNVAPDFHWSGTDDTYQQRQAIKTQIETQYSPAKVVKDATRTYNCHALAHAARHAWFDDIAQFLLDDYKQFTPGTLRLDDVVVYVKNNVWTHSGVITQLSGNNPSMILSKWGALSEVTHAPTNVPESYGEITYYLRRRDATDESDRDQRSTESLKMADNLIQSLLSGTHRTELLFASSVRAAHHVISSFPEIVQLQLNARAAGPELESRIESAELDSLAIIAVALSAMRHTGALAKLAARVSRFSETKSFDLLELTICRAFDDLLRESSNDASQFRDDCITKAIALIRRD